MASLLARSALKRAVRPAASAVLRSFHASAPARITYDEWIQAKPHCHHQSLWKEYKPVGPSGSLLSGDHAWAHDLVGVELNTEVVADLTEMCHYFNKVLATMPEGPYKELMTKATATKLKVLESGKSQAEMEEELGFGSLEEVHASVRGELEMIKELGKEWFKGSE